jgi:hypothetical protein
LHQKTFVRESLDEKHKLFEIKQEEHRNQVQSFEKKVGHHELNVVAQIVSMDVKKRGLSLIITHNKVKSLL